MAGKTADHLQFAFYAMFAAPLVPPSLRDCSSGGDSARLIAFFHWAGEKSS
jgi:hypothetical protein